MEAGNKSRIPGSRTRMRDRQMRAIDAVQGIPPQSRFASHNVPLVLWPDLLAEFGSVYTYHTAEGEELQGLRGILIEGLDDEPHSPGRYARFWVDLRDLPREPRSADWVLLNGVQYDVDRVDATLYDIARLVI